MAIAQYIAQPLGTGQRRALSGASEDHVICLLRMIERLPIVSEQCAAEASPEDLRRLLEIIHANHLELSQCATTALTTCKPCGDGCEDST